MRRFTLLLSLVCLLFGADVAKADKRVALVIGNGAYRTISRLANPPVDAEAMAGVLRDVGFDVVEGTNLTRDEMTGLSLEFARKARGADIAVLFYAGHGLGAGDTNFLLPVDADIKSDTDVKRGAGINVSHMLDQTMRDAKVKLVFLDACRDNPFVTAASPGSATRSDGVQSGLAGMEPGTGTLIAYATGLGQTALDGQKGVNSPFTRALVDHITRPGVEIRQAMNEVRAEVDRETNQRQLPWDQTNLTGAVYLNPVPAANATARASDAAAVSTGGASDVELQFWRSIRQPNTPARLNAYLDNFPAGHFKSLALARLAALETGPSATTRNLSGGPDPATFTADATEATEEQIGLSRTQRRDVQRRLTRLGFDTKVTGKFDPTTRAVITRWQEARGYPATGFLNMLQHKALLAEIITTTDSGANTDSDDKPTRHHRGGGRRHHGGGPLSGPGRFIGGVVGGLFR